MGKYNKHIIVVGSARSGTSWLSETLAKQFRYRMLFEPEHDTRTKNGTLICDQLITASSGFEKAIHYLHSVFSNRVDCDWIAQNSNRKYKMHLWPFIPKKFVIKFVRCNLSAQFINLYFGIPVIHIIRNPYDVLLSQQRVQFPWLYDLECFIKQDSLVALISKEYSLDIRNTSFTSNVEKLALRWCIENIVSLELLKLVSDNYKVVRHEDLREDLNSYLDLCKEFGLTPISDIKKEYTKPSTKTHPRSEILGVNAIAKNFTHEEYNKINSIFDTFRMSLYPKRDH